MSTYKEKKCPNILVVEDNPGDVRILQEAFKECHIANRMLAINNGLEAIRFLQSDTKGENKFIPDLILLDLNLPLADGREVLAVIKADPFFRKIPVLVLSSSDAKKDINDAYNLQANSYIVKPFTLDQYILMVRSINDYWLNTARLFTKDNF